MESTDARAEQAPLTPLVERKRLQARRRIVSAAEELFAARGFDEVSVSDIAARAEVGRTTFFRYFGDKSEVVFAKEAAMLEALTRAGEDRSEGAALTPSSALEQLRPLVVRLCEQATEDPAEHERHDELLARHVELRARDALKSQQVADRLSQVLRDRGTTEDVAVFAAQIALACYQSAKRRARTPGELPSEVDGAFDEALALGRAAAPGPG